VIMAVGARVVKIDGLAAPRFFSSTWELSQTSHGGGRTTSKGPAELRRQPEPRRGSSHRIPLAQPSALVTNQTVMAERVPVRGRVVLP
jgi:hypothetical protein